MHWILSSNQNVKHWNLSIEVIREQRFGITIQSEFVRICIAKFRIFIFGSFLIYFHSSSMIWIHNSNRCSLFLSFEIRILIFSIGRIDLTQKLLSILLFLQWYSIRNYPQSIGNRNDYFVMTTSLLWWFICAMKLSELWLDWILFCAK